MDFNNTYNPVARPTKWQRIQDWAYTRYGVDAGKMLGTMVCAFILPVALGVAVVAQM